VIEALPVQEPLERLRVLPSVGVPEIEGAVPLTGGPVIVAVSALVAEADPALSVAGYDYIDATASVGCLQGIAAISGS